MRILFTGGSSFTGYWFIKELVRAGHEVVATFQRPSDHYSGTRWARVNELTAICRPIYKISFGDHRFLALIAEGKWDLLCHHGADAADYKSPDFDVAAALRNNTFQLRAVLDALQKVECANVLLTGSVFENGEGAGSAGLPAFSPYGLSKSFTWQVFRYHAQVRQMTLGKFVIPNPFGPYEEPRFTYYLMERWFGGAPAEVNTPSYVRDNIHASLLAKSYVRFAAELADGINRINPSGYIESQGAFTQRVALEMRKRLGLRCEFKLNAQTNYPEPLVRINTDRTDGQLLGWDEANSWDELARYYERLLSKG